MTNFIVKKKKMNVLEILKVSCLPGILESWWKMFSNLKKNNVYLSYSVKLVKKKSFSDSHQPVWRCQPPFSLKMLQS